jgi:hypothetical protein
MHVRDRKNNSKSYSEGMIKTDLDKLQRGLRDFNVVQHGVR